MKRGLTVGILMLILIILFYPEPNKKLRADKDIITMIEKNYITKSNIIKNYGRDDNLELLSESQGLYMEYLLLRRDKKRFEEQFKVLQDHFIVYENSQYFVKWKIGDNVTTNALVDDVRIIKVLIEASEVFETNKYKEIALKLSQGIKQNQIESGVYLDFYDWKLNARANTIHFSYLNTDGIEKGNLPIENAHILLQLYKQKERIFYPEYYSVEKNQFLEENRNTVNLIDQFLIEIHLAEMGRNNSIFESWVREEIEENGKLYGQYTRSNNPVASVSYESSSVYSLATIYFLKTKDYKMAEILHKKLMEFDLQAKDDYSSIHFFDLIHYAIATHKFNHNDFIQNP
ncbi:hypothetical protein [Mesobacillus jeotgali]|uniref:hypothetical protein n=1 Tax=Mesobacillus jeotgali TaxID=129985 RepID=UPI0009A797D0|nr:hypothetical protein [Mesobacillus jeotgali]